MAGCNEDYRQEGRGYPKDRRGSRRNDGGDQRQQISLGREKEAALRPKETQ